MKIALFAVAGTAVAASAQTLDLGVGFYEVQNGVATGEVVDGAAAAAGTYAVALTATVGELAGSLGGAPEQTNGLLGLVRGDLSASNGFAEMQFISGSEVIAGGLLPGIGGAGAAGIASFDAFDSTTAEVFVGGPEVAIWDATSNFELLIGLALVEHDGVSTVVEFADIEFYFGLFAGSGPMNIDTGNGTAYDQGNLIISGARGVLLPTPSAAGVFGVTVLAAARRRR